MRSFYLIRLRALVVVAAIAVFYPLGLQASTASAPSALVSMGAELTTPVVETQAATNVMGVSAMVNGTVSDTGIPNATAYGFCWNTTGAPTTANTRMDKGALSATGAFNAQLSGLTPGTKYYVRAFATNTSGTVYGTEITFTTLEAGLWTGMVNSDWNDPQNWAGEKVPTASTNVTFTGVPLGSYLPLIMSNYSVDCNNMTSEYGGILEIANGPGGYGSLIIHGTVTKGILTDIYYPRGKWNLIAPAVAGGQISEFLYNSNYYGEYIDQETIDGTTYYGMKNFNETSGQWNGRYTLGDQETFAAGKGYLMSLNDETGYLYFSGVPATGNQSVKLAKDGSGWNCIGNPYTSSIDINSTQTAASFLYLNTVANTGRLDNSYAAVYTWDPDVNRYKVICNAGCFFTGVATSPVNPQHCLQPGTGFFVKAASAGVPLNFTVNMQSHQRYSVPSGNSWPAINVSVSNGSVTGSTVIAFNSAMTNGLDMGYDAGLLRDSCGLSVFSRLVTDNGVDFAIQCLPENYGSLVIPIGVESQTASSVSFSAATTQLPASCEVILEDRQTSTFTSLKNNATYAASVQPGTKVTGRFFLHTNNLTTDVNALSDKLFLRTYAENGQIVVTGEVSAAAKICVYSTSGQLMYTASLNEGSFNSLPAASLTSGTYIVRVVDGTKRFSAKLLF